MHRSWCCKGFSYSLNCFGFIELALGEGSYPLPRATLLRLLNALKAFPSNPPALSPSSLPSWEAFCIRHLKRFDDGIGDFLSSQARCCRSDVTGLHSCLSADQKRSFYLANKGRSAANEPLRLRDALERHRKAAGLSLAAIATAAKIATKTVFIVRTGKLKKHPTEPRQKQGLAESLTRLALYLKVEPRIAVAEFGLDAEDADVAFGMDRARRTAQRPQMVKDQTLEDMELRRIQSMAAESTVDVGLLDWSPFHRRGEANSFATLFMRRLLQAINPYWIVNDGTIDGMRDAITGLTEDSPKYHIVFGLYDLAYRRAFGLNFVRVPGLSIELGAVTSRKLTWNEILSASDPKPIAFVLAEEAGFHLLRGACGYDADVIRPIGNRDPQAIARELVLALDDRTLTRDVIFVADANTCAEVETHLRDQSWQKNWPTGRKLPTGDLARRFLLLGKERNDPQRDWAPRYPVGIAIRADSPRLHDLLVAAIRNELFDYGRLATAQLYQRLREQPNADHLRFDRDSFLECLGRGGATVFADAWEEVIRVAQERNPSVELPSAVEQLLPEKSAATRR